MEIIGSEFLEQNIGWESSFPTVGERGKKKKTIKAVLPCVPLGAPSCQLQWLVVWTITSLFLE